MTQRSQSLARSGVPQRMPMDRAWSAGYLTVSLLAIAAACAVAGGETANAQCRCASVAIGTAPPPQDICAAGSGR